jgi:uncharacterized membrane protein
MPPLMRLSSRQLIFIGFICVLLGFLIPFLTVLKYIEQTFFLAFVTYALQLIGLILGVVGAAMMGLQRTNKDKDKYK